MRPAACVSQNNDNNNNNFLVTRRYATTVIDSGYPYYYQQPHQHQQQQQQQQQDKQQPNSIINVTNGLTYSPPHQAAPTTTPPQTAPSAAAASYSPQNESGDVTVVDVTNMMTYPSATDCYYSAGGMRHHTPVENSAASGGGGADDIAFPALEKKAEPKADGDAAKKHWEPTLAAPVSMGGFGNEFQPPLATAAPLDPYSQDAYHRYPAASSYNTTTTPPLGHAYAVAGTASPLRHHQAAYGAAPSTYTCLPAAQMSIKDSYFMPGGAAAPAYASAAVPGPVAFQQNPAPGHAASAGHYYAPSALGLNPAGSGIASTSASSGAASGGYPAGCFAPDIWGHPGIAGYSSGAVTGVAQAAAVAAAAMNYQLPMNQGCYVGSLPAQYGEWLLLLLL